MMIPRFSTYMRIGKSIGKATKNRIEIGFIPILGRLPHGGAIYVSSSIVSLDGDAPVHVLTSRSSSLVATGRDRWYQSLTFHWHGFGRIRFCGGAAAAWWFPADNDRQHHRPSRWCTQGQAQPRLQQPRQWQRVPLHVPAPPPLRWMRSWWLRRELRREQRTLQR
jgi:hypothetical protein